MMRKRMYKCYITQTDLQEKKRNYLGRGLIGLLSPEDAKAAMDQVGHYPSG
jgi:hypothetical protein